MELKDIVINIGSYNDTINDIFPNQDLVPIDDLIQKIQDLYCEVDSLKEEIEDLKTPKEEDEHTAWQDQQLEMGLN